MVSVTVFVDSEHQYESIRMLGHAGLADDHQEGQELVCAAVSALVLKMCIRDSIYPIPVGDHVHQGRIFKKSVSGEGQVPPDVKLQEPEI